MSGNEIDCGCCSKSGRMCWYLTHYRGAASTNSASLQLVDKILHFLYSSTFFIHNWGGEMHLKSLLQGLNASLALPEFEAKCLPPDQGATLCLKLISLFVSREG